MSEFEFRRQLLAAVEEHPASMTPDAEAEMERLLAAAAERLAAEPSRVEEARDNLQRFLDHAAQVRAGEEGGGVDIFTIDRMAVDADSIQLALRDLCPFFPIC